jgi:predicted PurR-regulated permease PerM
VADLSTKKVGQLFRIVLIVSIYSLFALLFWPFAKSILFAVLFAFALNPVLQKLKTSQNKITNEKWLVLTLVNSIVGLFFVPLLLIIISAVSTIKNLKQNGFQNASFFQNLESALTRVTSYLQQISQDYGYNLSEQLDLTSNATLVAEKLFGFLTSIVTQLPWFLFQFLVFCVVLYFLLLNREFFKTWLLDLKVLTGQQVQKLSGLFEETCYLVLVSSVLVSTVQAIIVSFACLIAGYNDFLIIFMISFFMSFIPVVGSAPVSLSLIVYSLFQQQYAAAIVLIVAASIASVADNIIRAVILSKKEDSAHPMISLLSLIGAISLFGFVGLFLGPIVTELAFKISKIIFYSKNTESALL